MHKYKDLSEKDLRELQSNFLIDSVSYSKIAAFSRNPKSFEMQYIYNQRSKSSATTVAGQAYHYALDRFFTAKQNGEDFDVADLLTFAFDYIEDYKVPFWKVQKTTPTIEDCKLKATKTVTQLINNFFAESHVYFDEIKQILDVEVYVDEYLTVNGVDLPLPFHMRIDLVIETHSGKIVIPDHKSKSAFSNEEDLRLTTGQQAITYVKGYEAKTGLEVNEVWFIENKYSKNKDNSAQLSKYVIEITPNTRKLYEALLYEPLKRLVSAVNDPDYVYVINTSDNLIDKSELYDFWCKTMIAEIEDFNVPDNKKDLIAKRLKKIRDVEISNINPSIIKQFKEQASQFIQYDLSNKNMSPDQKIEHILKTFSIPVRVAHTFTGYSSNSYLLEVSSGVKIASIQTRRLDIANALDVSNVRISRELVVHDGKSYVAVEATTNNDKTLYWDKSKLVDMKIPLGEDNFGNVLTWDLNNQSTPHCLVGGGAGSGKSVELISILEYAIAAGVDNIVILDPKFEFTAYANRPGIKVYNEILDIENEMKRLVDEMNEKVRAGRSDKCLVIFDEFTDAVMTSRKGTQLDIKEEVQDGFYAPKKVMGMLMPPQPKMKIKTVGQLKSLNENVQMLLQKGRSTGYRVICAAQRADTNVITGNSKVNLAVQICFKVQKQVDSIVILDEPGGEALRGRGDGLIRSPQYNDTTRFQGYYFAS